MTTIWFFECKGYLESLAAEVQMGWATSDYRRRPADTGLAIPFYAARLINPGQFRRVMFQDGKTGGRSQVSFGEVELSNENQQIDNLRHFAFDGREAKLLRGVLDDDGVLVAGSLVTEIEFQIDQPQPPFNRYRFTIVDRLAEFAGRALQSEKFAGTQAANDVNAEPGVAVFDGNLIGTVNGTDVADVTTAVTNFDARNDRLSTTPANPTIATDGTAVDHVVNTDGSSDISFEWAFSGSGPAYNIDGFLIYVRASTSASSYTFGSSPAEETIYSVPADKLALILTGVATNKYYTFGVQAYRIVDPDVNASGVIRSSISQPSIGGENPYQPSSSVAFAGTITGTIGGASDAGDLAVKNTVATADIDTAAVTYTQLDTNAATKAVTDTDTATSLGSSTTPVAAASITTQGGPVLVQIFTVATVNASWAASGRLIQGQIYRNGATLEANQQIFQEQDDNYVQTISLTLSTLSIVGTGTHNYSFQAYTTTANDYRLNNTLLLLIELRR